MQDTVFLHELAESINYQPVELTQCAHDNQSNPKALQKSTATEKTVQVLPFGKDAEAKETNFRDELKPVSEHLSPQNDKSLGLAAPHKPSDLTPPGTPGQQDSRVGDPAAAAVVKQLPDMQLDGNATGLRSPSDRLNNSAVGNELQGRNSKVQGNELRCPAAAKKCSTEKKVAGILVVADGRAASDGSVPQSEAKQSSGSKRKQELDTLASDPVQLKKRAYKKRPKPAATLQNTPAASEVCGKALLAVLQGNQGILDLLLGPDIPEMVERNNAVRMGIIVDYMKDALAGHHFTINSQTALTTVSLYMADKSLAGCTPDQLAAALWESTDAVADRHIAHVELPGPLDIPALACPNATSTSAANEAKALSQDGTPDDEATLFDCMDSISDVNIMSLQLLGFDSGKGAESQASMWNETTLPDEVVLDGESLEVKQESSFAWGMPTADVDHTISNEMLLTFMPQPTDTQSHVVSGSLDELERECSMDVMQFLTLPAEVLAA